MRKPTTVTTGVFVLLAAVIAALHMPDRRFLWPRRATLIISPYAATVKTAVNWRHE